MAQPNTVTIGIDLRDGMRFESVGEDAVTVVLDSDAMHDGAGNGFRPMELMLVALGGCTGMDVISILRKKRQDVTGYRIEVTGTKAPDYPRVFTHIAVRHIVHGNNIREDTVRHAVALSEEKYCPAFAMLSKAAEIASNVEVHPASPAD
jgi:putative redox protein